MLRILFLSTVVCLLVAGVLPAAVLAGKDYYAETFDVLVDIQPDGSLLVTETVTFRFDGGPFTYVFREIPRVELDDIQVLETSKDGIVLPLGGDAGQAEIVEGDPVRVTWHFEPTRDSTHVFVLSYRVEGAIQHGTEADSLLWRAIPAGHEYLVERSFIQIRYPSGLVPLGDPALHGSAFEMEEGQGKVIFTTSAIPPDTEVKAELSFPAGNLASQPPAWQRELEQRALEEERMEGAFPLGLGAAVVTGVLGTLAVILFGRGFRREEDSVSYSSQNFTAPPASVPPALAAHLTHSGTAFLGTLFDLARRAMLCIEEGPKKWGSRTFDVVRQPIQESLKPHEKAFMQVLFRKAKENRISLSDISSVAYAGEYTKAIEAEASALGWQDAERITRRNRFLILAGLGLLAGMVMVIAGILLAALSLFSSVWINTLGIILIGAGIGASLASLAGVLVAALISTLSAEGLRQTAAWNSFTGYLRNVTRGREPAVAPNLFELYLPYAAGFGIAAEWAKFFEKMANVPIPAWFQGLQSSMDDGGFVAIMAAVSAADSSASVATGADGGGGSGGGSSGAG